MSRHESSDCHKEAVQGMIVRPQTTRDIGEQLSEIHSRDKRDNRLLLKILQNIRFLACQNIALRGDNKESESNFVQVLKLRGKDDSRVQQWLEEVKGHFLF